MDVVIKRDGDKKLTTYEIGMPWKFITPVVGKKNGHFRLGIIINNNDGEGRGWMDWTFSMVGDKKPYAFVDVFLK